MKKQIAKITLVFLAIGAAPLVLGWRSSSEAPTPSEICEVTISLQDNNPWGGIVKIQNILACKDVSPEKLSQALSVLAVRASYHEFASEAGPFHIWFDGKVIKSLSEGGRYYFVRRIDGMDAFALGDCSEIPGYPDIDSDMAGRIAVIYPCSG